MLYSNSKFVYCPMCQITHINDSQCQRNDMMNSTPNKELYAYALDLVNNYGEYDADNKAYHVEVSFLPEYIRAKFASLCLEADGRDTSGCYADESVRATDDITTIKLLRMLADDSTASKIELAKSIRAQTIRRYTNYMQEVLDDAAADYTDSFHYEVNAVRKVIGNDVELRRAI